jgi:hypothetical protein
MLLAANHIPSSPIRTIIPATHVRRSSLATKLSRKAVFTVRVTQCTEYRHAVFRAQGYHDLDARR